MKRASANPSAAHITVNGRSVTSPGGASDFARTSRVVQLLPGDTFYCPTCGQKVPKETP